MKCFNHVGADAVGVCRHCGRALCHDCVEQVEEAVACKCRCEERVRLLRGSEDLAAKLLLVSRPVQALGMKLGVVMIALGIGMLALGIVAAVMRLDKHPAEAAFVGALSLTVGVFTYGFFRHLDHQTVTRK